MHPPQKFSSSDAACCTRESEELACQAKTGDEQDQARLLLLFEPLLCNCAKRAALMLPHEDRAVLVAETRYAFLLLLGQFDPEQGVPFVGYIKTKLCFHMFNWCRLEQNRLWSATSFDEDAFENTVCAAWLNQNAHIAGGGEIGEWLKGEVERLPERQKLVMQLVAQGLSEREIGVRLGISGVRVHQLKAQVKKTLRKKFEIFCDGP